MGALVVAGAFGFPSGSRPAARPCATAPPLAGADVLGAGAAALPAVRSLTVAGVTASRERAEQLCRSYGADLENMEGFAVAYACAWAGLPCVRRAACPTRWPARQGRKRLCGSRHALAGVLPALNCN